MRTSWASTERQLRSRVFLHLDLLEANQDLASECVCQIETDDQEALAKKAEDLGNAEISNLLDTLNAVFFNTDVMRALNGRDRQRISRGLRHAGGRLSYLRGRLAAASASMVTAAVVETVQRHFALARQSQTALSEAADLALGEFLLRAALQGEGDVKSWHERALTSFDRVMHSTEPTRRYEAARAYAVASNERSAVLKHARDLAKRKT